MHIQGHTLRAHAEVEKMYGSHYSDKPPKESGDSWEEQTLRLLQEVFPNEPIESQVKFPELPRAIIDFYVPRIKLAIECKACGLTPVQERVLIEHQRRQNVLKSRGVKYVWWVDRERASLVPRTRAYLENVFYNCLGEQKTFVEFLKECQAQAHK
jgi:hypothetical protein